MSHEPEWLTRKTRIDGRLRALDWEIVPHSSFFRPEKSHLQAVAEYPTGVRVMRPANLRRAAEVTDRTSAPP